MGTPAALSAHAARLAGAAPRPRSVRVLAQAAPERPSGGGARLRVLMQAAPERPAGGGARMPPGDAPSSFETPAYQSPSYSSAQPGADGRPSGGGARGSPTPQAADQAAPAAPAPAPAAAPRAAPPPTSGNVVVQVTSPPTSVSINGEVATNGVLTPAQIYEKVGAAAEKEGACRGAAAAR